MRPLASLTALGTMALLATAGVALASPVVTWNPRALGLNGASLAADALLLGDYAQVVTSGGGLAFTDTGYLPVEGFSVAGHAVTPAGFNDPSGHGWGAYVRYTGSGTQTLSPYGLPAATYTQLSYQIIGYDGLAAFAFGADGAPVVGGTVKQAKVLASGSLISGQLAFVPISPTALSIQGSLSATIQGVPPQFSDAAAGALDLSIVHPPGEYAFTSPSSFRIAAADGVSATFGASGGDPPKSESDGAATAGDPPATLVPEPASLAALATGLLCLGGLRRRRGGA